MINDQNQGSQFVLTAIIVSSARFRGFLPVAAVVVIVSPSSAVVIVVPSAVPTAAMPASVTAAIPATASMAAVAVAA